MYLVSLVLFLALTPKAPGSHIVASEKAGQAPKTEKTLSLFSNFFWLTRVLCDEHCDVISL
jgi:hypothetical protein